MSPSEQYGLRLQARQLRAANCLNLHRRLGNLRLLLALGAAVLLWASLFRHALGANWLALPVVMFLLVALYHSRVLRAGDEAERAVSFYRDAIDRLEDRWPGKGQKGERFADPHHLYAADLDLFGEGGLFELLSAARTRMGEATLAEWLLAPAAVSEVHERQEMIRELRDQLDWREDLAGLSATTAAGVHPDALTAWAESPHSVWPGWVQPLAPALVFVALASVLVWGFDGPRWPLLVVLVGEAILAQRLRKSVEEVLHGTERGLQDLRLLRRLLARIEGSKFRSPRLQALQQRLASGRLTSSRAIARLVTIGDAIESRDNLILRVLNLPLLYSVQVAFWAERWRRSYGRQVRVWLEAVGELEALISLSTYSFEHPDDPFPELVAGPAGWTAEELGHPLIPAKKCVRNSLELDRATRVLLVSGSNMSGKSTLLRTIGINTVLAMAGAPVRAKRLRLTPLEIGASISNHDSLQQGSSRFYAEITRLRAIVARAETKPPLLFLLDELLQGTNSKDRRIGAQALVHALIARGAIGLVSTHDLALTDIGEPGENWLANVHFEDHLENGKMRFDYRLREGVVSKSNGLELMRSIGLEV